MRRILMAMALAGLVVACGDDDDDGDDQEVDGGRRDSGVDSGVDSGRDGGMDAGDSSVAAKVTNVGAMCSAASQCMGPAAICQTNNFTGSPNPGGACSAVCSRSAECGTNGNCPAGEAIAMFGAAATARLGDAGYCTQSCTLGNASSCRAGYTCVTLDLLSQATGGQAIGVAPLTVPFCFPVSGDAGVSDGGTSVDAGGMDGG